MPTSDQNDEPKRLLSACLRRFDREVRLALDDARPLLIDEAKRRKQQSLPPTKEQSVLVEAVRDITIGGMAAYLTTFVALRYLQRNQWPRPSILGTVLKCTAAGMVGAFATSGFAIRTTFPKVLELDESILADRLCPALGAFRPCLERADCRKLLQDRMEPFIVCQEACQRRTSLFRGPAPPGDFAGDGFSDGAGGFGDGGSGGFGGDGGGGGATDGGDFGASDGGDGCSGGSFGGITDVEPESGAYGDTGSGSWGDAVSGGVGGGNGTGWAGGAGKL